MTVAEFMKRIRDLSPIKQTMLLAVAPFFMAFALLSCVDVMPHKGPLRATELCLWIVMALTFFFFSQGVNVILFCLYALGRTVFGSLQKKSDGHRPPLHQK